ncbi:MAG: enoyl-CoA hydratase/isomerase family protein [Hyphomicrobiaceae bacterium]
MSIVIAARHAAGIIRLGTSDRAGRLGGEECRMLAPAYARFARDPVIYALVVRSQYDGAFAQGLDVREMAEASRRDEQAAASAIGDMLRVCWQQECFTKPVVSLIDGPVEGGAPGVSLYGTHRVAGERYRFSCGATGRGLVPAGGLGHVLARLANSVGIYLALTGHGIGRGDAFRHGLATHCVDARHFEVIEEHLADADPVDPVVDGLHVAPGDAWLAEHEPVIARCFSADTVEEILERLDSEAGHGGWARQVAADLRKQSPLALKVSLELLKKARSLDLRSYLILEYGVLAQLISRPDVQRAILGGTSAWEPASLGAVTEGLRAAVLAAQAGAKLTLPARADMQTQA